MVKIATLAELEDWVGKELGVSDWIAVDQDRIDGFAEATEDRQWIHLDTERAKTDMPGGKTIAHGFLTLSLTAGLMVFSVPGASRAINYGLNRVRFTNTVPAGSRVRLRQSLASTEPVKGDGVRCMVENTIEIEGTDRPAMVGEALIVFYP